MVVRAPIWLYRLRYVAVFLMIVSGFGGCDSNTSTEERVLVLTGFLQADQPFPTLDLQEFRITTDGSAMSPEPVVDATVQLVLDRQTPVLYQDLGAGQYGPQTADPVPPQASFSLSVFSEGQRVEASGTVPPALTGVQASATPIGAPVMATYETAGGTTVINGIVQPVAVTITWAPIGAEHFWIRPHVRLPASFASQANTLPFQTEALIRETDVAVNETGSKQWVGQYGVPLHALTDTMPSHQIPIFLVRGGADYAQYYASSLHPTLREPWSNVVNGRGIVVGLALADTSVSVHP